MSLSLSLQNALSGLQTAKAALDVVANNVANANTDGYSRKVVNITSRTLSGEGRGVEIASITRQVNDTLVKDLRGQNSTLGAAKVQDEFFSRMQDLFGNLSSNTSLSAGLADLAAAMTAAAATPENATLRSTIVSEAAEFARQMNDMAAKIQDLRVDAEREIGASLNRLNERLKEVASLNTEITRAKILNQPTGELEDKRDIAINEIARDMDVTFFTRETGAAVLMTSTGLPIVDTHAQSLTHSVAAALDASVTYSGGGIGPISVNGTDVTGQITGGRLGALIAMRDTELVKLGAELDRLAGVLKTEINKIHNMGAGTPPAATLTGTTTITGGAGAAFSGTGSVRIAAVNADGTFATAPLDINLAAHASVGSVVTAINAGLAGFATASINAQNQLVITANNTGDGIAINENTSAVGGVGFSAHFGLNDFFVGSASVSQARTLAVRSDLAAAPQLLASAELSLTASGGVVANQTLAVGKGDNRNATRLVQAFAQPFSFAAAGGLSATTTSFADYATQILTNNSARAANASDRSAFHSDLLNDLKSKAASVAGVNMDEELANLVLFQAAYNASARVVAAANEMLQTLEELTR